MSDPFPTHAPGKTINQLSVGDSASLSGSFSQEDIDAFARISGDDNPAHVDAAWAEASSFGGRVAHGVLTAGLISAVLGTQLPGPGSIYLSQTLRWLAPVLPGDILTATATVKEIIPDKKRVVLDTIVQKDGETVLTGEALVVPPVGEALRSRAVALATCVTPGRALHWPANRRGLGTTRRDDDPTDGGTRAGVMAAAQPAEARVDSCRPSRRRFMAREPLCA